MTIVDDRLREAGLVRGMVIKPIFSSPKKDSYYVYRKQTAEDGVLVLSLTTGKEEKFDIRYIGIYRPLYQEQLAELDDEQSKRIADAQKAEARDEACQVVRGSIEAAVASF